ncbi:MAG TPA: PDGLE domain-containing protein [Candidatus Limnocylindria bacterium]|jgi:hypothetical protein
MTNDTRPSTRSRTVWVVVALAIVVVVVVAASFLASTSPDGLERVAEDHGFGGLAQDSPFSIMPDYVFPGVDGPLATVIAGVIGVGVVLGVVWLVGSMLARRRPQDPEA